MHVFTIGNNFGTVRDRVVLSHPNIMGKSELGSTDVIFQVCGVCCKEQDIDSGNH